MRNRIPKSAEAIVQISQPPDSPSIEAPWGLGRTGLGAWRRCLSCIRYREVLLLQGTPLLGALFAVGTLTPEKLATLAAFSIACILLVAHILVFNDWAGFRADLNDPRRAPHAVVTKGVTSDQIGNLGVALLVLSLLLFCLLGRNTDIVAAAIVALSILYSLRGKSVPVLSSAAHLAGGVLYFLLGYCLFATIDRRAILISLFFALTVAAGHLTHEARDYDGDRANGIRTNAVAFGRRNVLLAGAALFTLAYVYCLALAATSILPRGLVVIGLLCPLQIYWTSKTLSAGVTFDNIRRLQSRYHALYAVIGISMLVALIIGA